MEAEFRGCRVSDGDAEQNDQSLLRKHLIHSLDVIGGQLSLVQVCEQAYFLQLLLQLSDELWLVEKGYWLRR